MKSWFSPSSCEYDVTEETTNYTHGPLFLGLLSMRQEEGLGEQNC